MAGALKVLDEISRCSACADHLPLGPRPILQFHPSALLLVAGQAPGRKAHDSGVPFADASGDRLRDWLAVSKGVFYDPHKIAIMPMGFCYPGSGRSGDLSPRPECVPLWRAKLLKRLQHLKLTVVIGKYALAYHLPDFDGSVTNAVRAWRDNWPKLVPLPHPSPRNNIWLRQNPWFARDLLPALKSRVAEIMEQGTEG